MPDAIDYSVLIILFIGIYSLAAGVGELRQPGFWVGMVDDIAEHSAIRFLVGMFCLAIGAVFSLIVPWDSSDWMDIAVRVVGGWMVIEGALFLAIGDLFMGFAKRLMGMASRLWAVLAILIGVAAIALALGRVL